MHLSEVPRQQAITSRTQLVKGIMQRCNDCIGHKKVMMSGRALFRHPQSVIVSYWCMRHNAKLGDHVTRSCSRTSATSNHTQDHRLAGLYRRRDEPLGQAFAAQGRTELSSREQHWTAPVQLAGSAASVHGDGRLRPHPQFPTHKTKKKAVDPIQNDTKTTQKETNSERG